MITLFRICFATDIQILHSLDLSISYLHSFGRSSGWSRISAIQNHHDIGTTGKDHGIPELYFH